MTIVLIIVIFFTLLLRIRMVIMIIVAALCQDCCLPGTWYLTFCIFDKKRQSAKILVLDLGDIFAGKQQQLLLFRNCTVYDVL